MRPQHIHFKTDKGDFKGHVSGVSGKAARVIPYSQFNAQIKSVITVGKEQLNDAEATRASLVLDAFRGGDSLLSSPFVRKLFFPGYPLHTLKWPQLPTSQPEIEFTYRQLNESQRMAVEKCLSNEEEDRHVVIVVSSTPSFPPLVSRRVLGAARNWKDHCDRCRPSQQDRRALFKYSLDYCPFERRGQERCREIGRIRIHGFQAPRLEGFPL